jgi:hypothetical protein
MVLAACSAPVSLNELEAESYDSTEAVLADLSCSEESITFHLGQGVANETDAIETSDDEVERNLGVSVERAVQQGENIWVLATAAGEVVGALDSRGGIALCLRSDYEQNP